MNRTVTLIIILNLVFGGVVFIKDASPWSRPTHKILSDHGAVESVLDKDKGNYLDESLGIKNGLNESLKWGNNEKRIRIWIQEGADLEDSYVKLDPPFVSVRFLNHFHNPLKSWDKAGLHNWYDVESSLLWGQDSSNQVSYVEGDQSWQKARDCYELALTSLTDEQRQMYFAKTFKALGHQMHLIQDMAVPSHVRNDAHIFKRNEFIELCFEPWAEENDAVIIDYAQNPTFPTMTLDLPVAFNGEHLVPVTRLVDTDSYDGSNPLASPSIGLAEYTNANFFSDDTIFVSEDSVLFYEQYFPYPEKSSTNLQEYEDEGLLPERIVSEDEIGDLGIWIKKEKHGEIIEHFVKPTYHTNDKDLTVKTYYGTFYRDELCHEDYASFLVPRAVGYSAELLDYFFRGKINMVQDKEKVGYFIENNTEEDMEGTFTIYYDNVYDKRVELWSGDFTIGSSSSGVNETDSFDFNPPNDAKDSGQYILVFRGILGNEMDAVVGKVVTLAEEVWEPFENSICEYNSWSVWSYIDGAFPTANCPELGSLVSNGTGPIGEAWTLIDGVLHHEIAGDNASSSMGGNTEYSTLNVSGLNIDASKLRIKISTDVGEPDFDNYGSMICLVLIAESHNRAFLVLDRNFTTPVWGGDPRVFIIDDNGGQEQILDLSEYGLGDEKIMYVALDVHAGYYVRCSYDVEYIDFIE